MNYLMAVKINGRIANAPLVQEILTHNGCFIKTRVGFHETNEDQCSTDGIVILQLTGQPKDVEDLMEALGKLEGVIPKMIEF